MRAPATNICEYPAASEGGRGVFEGHLGLGPVGREAQDDRLHDLGHDAAGLGRVGAGDLGEVPYHGAHPVDVELHLGRRLPLNVSAELLAKVSEPILLLLERGPETRLVGKKVVNTPWSGTFGDHQMLDGVRVPTAAEVTWHAPEGPFTYWRGRVTEFKLVR